MKAQLRREVERAYEARQEGTRWIKPLEDQEILNCGDKKQLRTELETYLEELTSWRATSLTRVKAARPISVRAWHVR